GLSARQRRQASGQRDTWRDGRLWAGQLRSRACHRRICRHWRTRSLRGDPAIFPRPNCTGRTSPMTFDSLIVNGDVVTEAGIQPLDIALLDGKIDELLPRGAAADARERIDAAGQLVLPGAIDIHFHCRAPAYPQRGDFATETRAAA